MKEEDRCITLSGYITISLEEYKDLLMTKGKYEELKSQQITPFSCKRSQPIPEENKCASDKDERLFWERLDEEVKNND